MKQTSFTSLGHHIKKIQQSQNLTNLASCYLITIMRRAARPFLAAAAAAAAAATRQQQLVLCAAALPPAGIVAAAAAAAVRAQQPWRGFASSSSSGGGEGRGGGAGAAGGGGRDRERDRGRSSGAGGQASSEAEAAAADPKPRDEELYGRPDRSPGLPSPNPSLTQKAESEASVEGGAPEPVDAPDAYPLANDPAVGGGDARAAAPLAGGERLEQDESRGPKAAGQDQLNEAAAKRQQQKDGDGKEDEHAGSV